MADTPSGGAVTVRLATEEGAAVLEVDDPRERPFELDGDERVVADAVVCNVDLPVAYRQVVALHQRQAEIVGEIDMLEIGFVVGTGRQQHGAGAGLRQLLAVLRIGQEAQLVGTGILQGAQAADDPLRVAAQAGTGALSQLSQGEGDGRHLSAAGSCAR